MLHGCYAQVSKDEMAKIDELDLILGNNEKNRIVEIIEKKIVDEQENKYEVSDISKQKEFLDFGLTEYNEKTRAVIKVQDGCDNFCTYCIIPYAKGRVRSRKIESIIQEIQKIVRNGIKEVVITGIQVAAYGRDFEDDISLIDLLEEINKIEGLKRIRLSSLEPKIITEEFVDRLKKLDKICHHFHLSLQSGCNETLKRMNRKYTIEEFIKVVELLRNTYPDVALTTDIIVGFPGETDEEFNITYEFLKNIKFVKMHVFKYSQRKGTLATKMKNQINPKIKEERSNLLIELSNQNEKEFLNQFIDKEVEVLFEENDDKYYKGHTSNYIMVKSLTNEKIQNELRRVKIKEEKNLELVGTLL